MKCFSLILIASLLGLSWAETDEEFYQTLLQKTANARWTPKKVNLEEMRRTRPGGCAFKRNSSEPAVFRSNLDLHYVNHVYDPPKSFDAREKWSQCASIKKIWNQSQCGSCWAFAAASCMSDRMCIHKDQHILVSPEDILACCVSPCGLGCQGGWPDKAFANWISQGWCTGGAYGESGTCKPYSIPPDAQTLYPTPSCYNTCTDNTYNVAYASDKSHGSKSYSIPTFNTKAMQEEIETNGPVSVIIELFDDFYSYSSGIYTHQYGSSHGTHAVRVLGWGEHSDGYPYWIVMNSWGEYWGENGIVKIARGYNTIGIEEQIDAGIP